MSGGAERDHPSASDITRLYHDHAADWPKLRSADFFERPWFDAFRAALPAAAAPARIIDLGCGSGVPIAAEMIARGHRLTGIDGAAGMLDLARARFPQGDWRLADMRALPVIGPDFGPFDGIIAWHSFFHLPRDDQRRMVATFARLAAPEAALIFTSGPENGEAIGIFQGAPLYHASLAPQEYRALLDAHGFAVLRHRVEDPDCGGATIWLAKRRA